MVEAQILMKGSGVLQRLPLCVHAGGRSMLLPMVLFVNRRMHSLLFHMVLLLRIEGMPSCQ